MIYGFRFHERVHDTLVRPWICDKREPVETIFILQEALHFVSSIFSFSFILLCFLLTKKVSFLFLAVE